MRFRFCYGQDCPDWVLEQINAASKQSAIRLKALVNEVAKHIIAVDAKKSQGGDEVRNRSDSKSGPQSEMAACIAWILSSAARSKVTDGELSNELGQLGLPKEHATAIASVYKARFPEISDKLARQWLRIYPTASDVSWRVEEVLRSSKVQSTENKSGATISIDLSDNNSVATTDRLVLSMSAVQLTLLTNELKKALAVSNDLVSCA